jgi:hypothetical protein
MKYMYLVNYVNSLNLITLHIIEQEELHWKSKETSYTSPKKWFNFLIAFYLPTMVYRFFLLFFSFPMPVLLVILCQD